MKKYWFLIVAVIIILFAFMVGRYEDAQLKSQLLRNEPPVEVKKPAIVDPSAVADDCLKFSEDLANECYFQLAVGKKDSGYCEQISRVSKQGECKREVELEQ